MKFKVCIFAVLFYGLAAFGADPIIADPIIADPIIADIKVVHLEESKTAGFGREPMRGEYIFETVGGGKLRVKITPQFFQILKNGGELFNADLKNEVYVDTIAWSDKGILLATLWKSTNKGASPFCLLEFDLREVPTAAIRELNYPGGLSISRVLSIKGDSLLSEIRIGTKKFRYFKGSVLLKDLKIVSNKTPDHPKLKGVGKTD